MKSKKKKQIEEENKKTLEMKYEKIPTRGRIFEGAIKKIFQNRVVIEMERTIYVPKYERFYKKKMRIHARISSGMVLQIGDIVRIQECRPLSKIIHAIVIDKVKSDNSIKQEAKK